MALQLVESPTPSSSSDNGTATVLVPKESVGMVWNVLEPLVAKATATTNKTDIETVREAATKGESQLWAVMDKEEKKPLAAIVTELAEYPNGFKSCQIMLCGGIELKRWKKSAMATLEEFARAEECDVVEIVGRRGWGKLYPEYREIERWFEKEI